MLNLKTLKRNKLQTENDLWTELCKIEYIMCRQSESNIVLLLKKNLFVSLHVIKLKYYLKKCKFLFIRL